MKKISLSSIAMGVFCSYSAVFGMENITVFEEEGSGQLSIGEQFVRTFSELRIEKNVNFACLGNLLGNSTETLMPIDFERRVTTIDLEKCVKANKDKKRKGKRERVTRKENELEAEQFGNLKKICDESDDSEEVASIQAAKQWHKIADSLKQSKLGQKKIFSTFLTKYMRQRWFGDPLCKAGLEVFGDEVCQIFDDLKEAYSAMEISTLLKGENIKEGTLSYFAWLDAIKDRLEDLGSFDKLIGKELNGVKQDRKYLRETCDELNKRLDNIKNSSVCLVPKLKVNNSLRCEIIRGIIEQNKTLVYNEQIPLQEFILNHNLRYLKKAVDLIEENVEKAIQKNKREDKRENSLGEELYFSTKEESSGEQDSQ